jgi:hypothetical protein
VFEVIGAELPLAPGTLDRDREGARPARNWKRIKPAVMERPKEGFWTQKRLTKEHQIVAERSERYRANGEKSGRPTAAAGGEPASANTNLREPNSVQPRGLNDPKSLKNNEPTKPTGLLEETQTKAPNPNPKDSPTETKKSPSESNARERASLRDHRDRDWGEG